jgi:hypothetical protein
MPQPTIYFLCPDIVRPSGGLRMIYRHVEILNDGGFSAQVVHYMAGFKADWFEHRARTTWFPIDVRPFDMLVFPEIDGPAIAQAMPGQRKIIFNQNAYYTFQHYPLDKPDITPAYLSGEVVATITVSQDSLSYLNYAFPDIPVHRVRYGIDPRLFYPPRQKLRQICFMPRKQGSDAQQVLSLLRFRGKLSGINLVPIDNKSHSEAAAILRDSMIFLSLGASEGFGLPAAEAMACGCVVVGYHGNGGREFMKPEFSFPIEVGDILGFARTLEQVIEAMENGSPRPRQMTQEASAFIRSNYSLEHEKADVMACWRRIVQAPLPTRPLPPAANSADA